MVAIAESIEGFRGFENRNDKEMICKYLEYQFYYFILEYSAMHIKLFCLNVKVLKYFIVVLISLKIAMKKESINLTGKPEAYV